MARPQLEDGHTKIANEIIEALVRINLSAYESRVFWCIVRKTYGWNKKSDRISYSQFEESIGMAHQHIGRTLKLLIERHMIICSGEGQKLEYGIQKDYEQWVDMGQKDIVKPVPKEVLDTLGVTSTPLGTSGEPLNQYLNRTEPVPNQDDLVPKEVPKPVPKEVHTKARKHYTKAIYKSMYATSQKFGELLNVFLTTEEHEKLVEKFGAQGATDWIEELSLAKASKGYKTKSDYATILAWERRRQRQGGGNGTNRPNTRALPKVYTRPEDL